MCPSVSLNRVRDLDLLNAIVKDSFTYRFPVSAKALNNLAFIKLVLDGNDNFSSIYGKSILRCRETDMKQHPYDGQNNSRSLTFVRKLQQVIRAPRMMPYGHKL